MKSLKALSGLIPIVLTLISFSLNAQEVDHVYLKTGSVIRGISLK